MPVGANLQFDIQLNAKGFMLWRDPRSRAQAWARTGVADAVSTQKRLAHSVYSSDKEYGGLPDDLDYPEVYDDWSGGAGDYVRRAGRDNHYHIGFNLDTRFPGAWSHAQNPQLLAARYASVSINADYFVDVPLRGVANPPAGAGTVLAVGRGYVAALTPTDLPYTAGSAFDLAYEATGGGALGFGHRPAVFGSYTYIPNTNGSGFYQRGHDGTTYTLSDKMPARWFQVAAGRMWRHHGRGYLQSIAIGADPLVTANWSATLNLANGYLISDDAISFEDRLFPGFPDGLYMGDQTGTFSNVTTDLGANVNTDNVRDITIHNGMVVFAEGQHIWGYRPASGTGESVMRQLWPLMDVRPVMSLAGRTSPLSFLTLPPQNAQTVAGLKLTGQIRCVTGFGRWLYAGVFTGSNSVVWCGTDASPGLPYVWHPMQLLQMCKVSRLHVDAVTAASSGLNIPRRMWAATDASWGAQTGCTAPIYYWPIPDGDNSPFADPTFSPNFTPVAYLEHGLTDADVPGTWKVQRKVEMTAELLLSANCQLWHAVALDASVIATMTNNVPGNVTPATMVNFPKDTLYFTNPLNSAVGQQMQMSALSSATLTSPIYHAHIVRGTMRPRSNDVITAKVHIADGLHDRRGGEMRDGQSMLKELRQFALSSTPYALVDLIGDTYPVVVQPTIEEEEVYQGGSDVPDIIATVKLGVLDASWPVAPISPFHPNGG